MAYFSVNVSFIALDSEARVLVNFEGLSSEKITLFSWWSSLVAKISGYGVKYQMVDISV